jgi:mannose/cellobiose epimerase-like protein (N-acyl-D-glucosamine 2-epimerase family)
MSQWIGCFCREGEGCAQGEALWEQVEACYRALHAVLLVGEYAERERAWRAYQAALRAYEQHLREGNDGVGSD